MQQEKHNKHEKIHYPGHKQQLEEVWEKQDHMEGQNFDPKTFFMMHGGDLQRCFQFEFFCSKNVRHFFHRPWQ